VGEFRVYLCDDDDGYRTLVRTVLSEDGMQIVGDSGDGAACVDAVEQAVADVVLLDLNMPGMNGFETLARLRDRLPAVRVIVLSTAADQTSQSAALRLGADGFISKPMRIFDLPDLVREAVRAAGEVADGHATEAVNP
jgi:DNA-binding NarL/FixJ family response regulator